MDQVSEIREKTDLIALISEYIPLKKTGANFKANCPFHQENTPSFVVSPERQIWHCFGCGKGGDAFSFLMDYENIEFPEAMRQLAGKAGITIKESSFQKGIFSQKEKIYKLNTLAARFYNYLLTKHAIGTKALDYLIKERGLNTNLIDSYSLGFSPSDNSLSKYLVNKKGYKKEDLVEAGLSFIRNGQIMDFFRGRIIFPLSDHRGNVVGFSGRALDTGNPSKYINTKETAVYHKGSLFFGLETAKDEIKKKDCAIIVEGEFDSLSAFKNGIKNVIAIKGTALTENQANLLSRFTKKVILCLDQDSAGFEATKRSLAPLEKNGMMIDVLLLSDKDPDEALKKNPGNFKKALKNAVSVYDFLISKITSENNIKTGEGIKKTTEELLPFFSQIQNEIVKEHYIKKLAKELDISQESLNKEIQKIESAKKQGAASVLPSQLEKKTRREILEQYFLSLIIQNENPKEILISEKKFFSNFEFDNLAFGKIYASLVTFLEKKDKLNSSQFVNFIPEEIVPAFDSCYLLPIPKFGSAQDFGKEMKKVEEELITLHVKKQMEMVAKKIKEAKDKGEQKDFQKKFSQLTELLTRI